VDVDQNAAGGRLQDSGGGGVWCGRVNRRSFDYEGPRELSWKK